VIHSFQGTTARLPHPSFALPGGVPLFLKEHAMIKKALITVVGLGLTTVVLFGRDAASYVGTTYNRLTSSVKQSVPVEFQIDRARGMVKDLEPEIRRSMHVIAKEEVALEQLNAQIGNSDEKAEKDKSEILRLQADLGQNKDVYHYASRTYSSEQVKQDLSRRFSRFKVTDETLANLKSMRDARERNLDAAQQKLAAMINARRKLEVDVQNLEAKRQLVEVALASSDYVFDDSQLARAKALINDIRTQLDVSAKLANADVNVEVEIPLDETAASDITDQVAEYFSLGGRAKPEVAEATTDEAPVVVTASYPQK
jgi:chromosome segregation ATPase